MGSSLVYVYSEGKGFVEIGRVVESLSSEEPSGRDYFGKPFRLQLSFKVDRRLREKLGKWIGYLPNQGPPIGLFVSIVLNVIIISSYENIKDCI